MPFIKLVGLIQLVLTSLDNDIDGDAFILLEEANLQNMIKSEGLRMKFKKALATQFPDDTIIVTTTTATPPLSTARAS